MSPLTAVPVVPIFVPFLINVPAETLIAACWLLFNPATVTGLDLYEIFGLALLIAGIENVFGIAPVPFIITVVLGTAIVNDSTSEIL